MRAYIKIMTMRMDRYRVNFIDNQEVESKGSNDLLYVDEDRKGRNQNDTKQMEDQSLIW